MDALRSAHAGVPVLRRFSGAGHPRSHRTRRSIRDRLLRAQRAASAIARTQRLDARAGLVERRRERGAQRLHIAGRHGAPRDGGRCSARGRHRSASRFHTATRSTRTTASAGTTPAASTTGTAPASSPGCSSPAEHRECGPGVRSAASPTPSSSPDRGAGSRRGGTAAASRAAGRREHANRVRTWRRFTAQVLVTEASSQERRQPFADDGSTRRV
jgi:hypothetical protein